MNRRQFLQKSSVAAAGTGAAPGAGRVDPEKLRTRAESMAWFREAKFGLFMHYGVYSILGRGEWVQLRERIPVADHARLKEQFRPEKFDADRIVAIATDAGMKYVNMTARRHDSFCLFRTK